MPMDADDEAFSGLQRCCCCCCCCFYIPYRSVARSSSSSVGCTDRASAGEGSRWWSRAVTKLREWSELVAGPRWKTFIRRFNRNLHPYYRHLQSTGMCSGRFQYDPLSYALNFDEGHGESPEGEHAVHRDFPARFAMIPPALPENPSVVLGPSAAAGDAR